MVSELPSPATPESLYGFITRQAAHASDRQLSLVLAGAMGGIAAALSASRWPLLSVAVGALSGSVVTVVLWGFAAHTAQQHGSRRLVWTQRLLVGLGMLLSIVGMGALLLAMLGQPWML